MEWQSPASASGKELSAVGGGVVSRTLFVAQFLLPLLLVISASLSLPIHTHPCAVTYTGRHRAQQNIAQMKMPISQR